MESVEPQEAQPLRPVRRAPGRTVRVLVVDDQAVFRRAAVAVVAAVEGFELVGEAGTGEAGVDAWRRLRPDLVLMDVNLPGIDGVEATRRIVTAPRPPVVLLLSTYDDDVGTGLAVASAAAGYLTKSLLSPAAVEAAWTAAGTPPDG